MCVGVVACGDNPAKAPPTISISPAAVTVGVGASVDVTATYTDADGATSPASDATFAVSGTTVASVSGSGGHATVHGLANGKTTLTVTGMGATATIPVMVTGLTLTKIAISPIMPSLAAGTTVQLTATGSYDNGTTADVTAMVTWASATTAKATVDAAGVVTAVAAGTSDITASLDTTGGKVTGTTTVTVTAAVLTAIEVTPTNPSLALGVTQQMVATGRFSDNSTQALTTGVTWTSSEPTHATVSADGLVTAAGVGATTITAKVGALMGTTTVTVTAAAVVSIEVTPAGASLALGRTLQYAAHATLTDRTVQDVTTQATWASSTDNASISNAAGSQGLATAVHVGDTSISAAFGGKTGSTTLSATAALLTAIALAPLDTTASAGTKVQYHATGTFSDTTTSDITTQVVWASSAEAFAQISNAAGSQGEATTIAPGPTTISATLAGITQSTTLTVNDAVLVSLAVTSTVTQLPIGATAAFTARGTFSDTSTQDLTAQVTWDAAPAATATVSNAAGSKGVVTAVAVGDATITASLGAINGSAPLTVIPAAVVSVVVAPKTATLAIAGTAQLAATATFTDHHSDDVTATATWTSSGPAATVSATGLVTGAAGGTATITAAVGAISDTASVTVQGFQIVSVSPPDAADQIRTSTPIVITFDTAIDPATLTTQTVTDACTGTLQLSKDNFVTCVGFATAAPTFDATGQIATALPASPLAFTTSYKVRVLGTVTTATGAPFGVTFTQAAAWKTAGVCAPKLVISQIYGGGGNVGGVFSHDFIELHNIGTTPISLTGLGIQYNSAAGTGVWTAQALPSATVPPGSYFLIQEANGANMPPQTELPAPDFTPTTPVAGNGVVGIAMSATSGRVALTLTPTPIAANADCATVRAASIDVVGYGAANCGEGTVAGGTTSPTGALRLDGGCVDTDNNLADFLIATPTPRNGTTSTAQVCSCPLTGFDGADEPAMSFLPAQ